MSMCLCVCLCRAVVSFAGLRVLCQCFLVVLCGAVVHKKCFFLSFLPFSIRMLGVDPRDSDLSVTLGLTLCVIGVHVLSW